MFVVMLLAALAGSLGLVIDIAAAFRQGQVEMTVNF